MYRAARGMVTTTELVAQTANLQRSQLLKALDSAYHDGFYRGSAYTYQMGGRDMLADVSAEALPLHGDYHVGATAGTQLAQAEQTMAALRLENDGLKGQLEEMGTAHKVGDAALAQAREQLQAVQRETTVRAQQLAEALAMVRSLEDDVFQGAVRITVLEGQIKQKTADLAATNADATESAELARLRADVSRLEDSGLDLVTVHAGVSGFAALALSGLTGPDRPHLGHVGSSGHDTPS